MTLPLAMLAALLAGAYIETPKTDLRTVKFQMPSLSVSRTTKSGSTYAVRGTVRVDMTSAKPFVRKPLLRIVCLADVGGDLQWMEGFWESQHTNEKLSRGAMSTAFKTAGREGLCSEPGCISAVMPFSSAHSYAAATYGNASDETGGFFRISRAAGGCKLLLYRFEIWQNGVCAEAVESSRAGLGPYNIPRDWFVRGRYADRFHYLKAN